MTKDEIIERLKKYEWDDVEFKLCQNGVSLDAYKTVSAFSNSAGGHLVFGIRDEHGKYEIVGVIDVDKVQNDFLSCIRSGKKFGTGIDIEPSIVEHGEKTLLVFYIPEASRKHKPIHLNGNINESYIRRAGGDEKCNDNEIKMFWRDSLDTSFDNQPLDSYDAENFFDESTVKTYRRFYSEKNNNKHADLSDILFLEELAFVVESYGRMVPKRAGLLMFGKSKYILNEVPRGVVAFRKINSNSEEWPPETRLQVNDIHVDNLFSTWLSISEKFYNISEIPFSLDSNTMMRKDEPVDYIAFREAAVNLLMHQDYGDSARTPHIKIFKDRISFWNPGDAFSSFDVLIDGGDKELRNPVIVRAFRQIGLCEQAGTGIRAIMRKCRDLGYVPAQINNDKSDKSFRLDIVKHSLITERQVLFQGQLGVSLTDNEASVFALVCQQTSITVPDVKSVILTNYSESLQVINRLLTQRLIEPVAENYSWKLAEHLRVKYEPAKPISVDPEETDQVPNTGDNLVTDQVPNTGDNLVTDQAPTKPDVAFITELSDQQRKTLLLCEAPRKLTEIMVGLGLSHKAFFRNKHLVPLIKANLIAMSYPEEPNHPEQAYTITDSGLALITKLHELEKRNQINDETNND
jgi:ATP-dependent DNA helicase RecG